MRSKTGTIIVTHNVIARELKSTLVLLQPQDDNINSFCFVIAVSSPSVAH